MNEKLSIPPVSEETLKKPVSGEMVSSVARYQSEVREAVQLAADLQVIPNKSGGIADQSRQYLEDLITSLKRESSDPDVAEHLAAEKEVFIYAMTDAVEAVANLVEPDQSAHSEQVFEAAEQIVHSLLETALRAQYGLGMAQFESFNYAAPKEMAEQLEALATGRATVEKMPLSRTELEKAIVAAQAAVANQRAEAEMAAPAANKDEEAALMAARTTLEEVSSEPAEDPEAVRKDILMLERDIETLERKLEQARERLQTEEQSRPPRFLQGMFEAARQKSIERYTAEIEELTHALEEAEERLTTLYRKAEDTEKPAS